MKNGIIITALIAFSSCLSSCNRFGNHEVGKYVYMDCMGTIHTDKNCKTITGYEAKTKEERMMKMRGVTFIDTAKISKNYYLEDGRYLGYGYSFCPICVDDKAYGRIERIIEHNNKAIKND